MEQSDLLTIGGSEALRTRLEEIGARTVPQEAFDPQSVDLKCRILLLIEPAPAVIETVLRIWPKGGPLLLVATAPERRVASDRYLNIPLEEVEGSAFFTLLKGLIRERHEREAHDLLARVSHEMRSPMAVIRMACQLVRRTSDEQKRLKHIEMIEESSLTIQTLIGDILDYSKLDQGTVALNITKFDLPSLLHNVIESTRLLAGKKSLSVESSLGGNVPRMVNGDPGRLRQILGNLLSNAVKFTEEGYVRLEVWTEGDVCHFQIEDTGIGIKEEALERIFTPYQQADSTILRRFGGTGLGLNICRMLARKMGGDVSVQSEYGKGSCFSFNIRLPRVAERVQVSPTVDWKGLDLWLLSAKVAMPWVEQARALGLSIQQFSDNQRAQGSAARKAPDILFFDLEGGGFPELENVLRWFPEKRPRVVALTSAGQRGDAARCKTLGVSGYLTGAVTFLDIQECIQLVIQPEIDELITRHTLKEQRSQM